MFKQDVDTIIGAAILMRLVYRLYVDLLPCEGASNLCFPPSVPLTIEVLTVKVYMQHTTPIKPENNVLGKTLQ